MKFAKLESLLPMDGVGQPVELKTENGEMFTVASRSIEMIKKIVIRTQNSGSLNESVTISMNDVIETAQIADEDKPFANALNDYLMQNIENSKLIVAGEHVSNCTTPTVSHTI